ncbi:MAG: threonine-phosphate decarboxylase [Hydrogenoanaerobacterium sp.]
MFDIIHGGDIYSQQDSINGEMLDFSANINPFGMAKGVREALVAAVEKCEVYPDPLCRRLTAAVAENEDVPLKYVLCGAGASDLIYRLVYAVRPKTGLVLAPCFAEYEQALAAVGCAVRRHALREEDDFALTEGILSALTADVDIFFLCNPNNPTGSVVERELLCRILKRCKENNIILALDECFNDFLDEPQSYTMKEYLGDYENLIIFKAFTKMYALAGVRLGYVMCKKRELLGAMYACGSPWDVSVPAQLAGVRATKEKAYVKKTRALIKAERQFLKDEFAALGCRVYASQANYIFFSPHVAGLRKKLAASGILVRDCGNYKGLSGEFCRVAVKTHHENMLLLSAMKELI